MQIVSLTNAQREQHKVPAVKENPKLTKAAEARVKDMFDKDYWDHFAPDGKEPWDAIKAQTYEYSYAGENLAKGFTDANSTVQAWMNSQTHKENLLNSNYEEIGIAVASGNLKGRNTTIIVQLFASPFEKGVKPVTAFGKNVEAKQMNISNLQTTSNQTYLIAWIFVSIMLIADGIMLYRQGHHKDRHHKIHFGLASIFAAMLFSILTIQVVNIL